MHRSRMGLLVVWAAAAVAAVFAVRQGWAARHAGARFAALSQRNQYASAKVATLETQVREQARRAAAIAADNATLRDALARAQSTRSEAAAKPAPPLAREALEERFRLTRGLGQRGEPAEALRELLWHWDEGMKQNDTPVWRSRLVAELRNLVPRHPPAWEELRQRRDALRARILAGPGGEDFVRDYTSILQMLGEEPAALGLLDHLPAGDRRRRAVTIYASDELIAAKRYTEAMEGKSAGSLLSSFETKSRSEPMAAPARDGGPSLLARFTAQDIELLAGAGLVADARELARRLLALDRTENTRALVQHHAERAGQPALLANPAP